MTSPIVLITGADRGLGLGLAEGLLRRGWQVFAGQYMPAWHELAGLLEKYPQSLHLVPLDVSSIESTREAAKMVADQAGRLDVLISNAGIYADTEGLPIRQAQHYEDMHRLYDVNALGALRVVESFIGLMDAGGMKRLCFVSSEAGSIGNMRRTALFGYTMSKAALNMAVKILFNDLRKDGYTFRVYHPGWVRSYMSGTKNMNATLEPDVAAEAAIPIFLNDLEDEDRLRLIDYEGNEWPW